MTGSGHSARVRARDVVVFLLFVVGLGAVLLLGLGGAREFARDGAGVLYEMPGGSWTVGGLLVPVSVLGYVGGTTSALSGLPSRTGRLWRVGRSVARAVCWVAAIGPVSFLLSGLPGRNCRFYEPGCAYVPGTGTALLVYAVGTFLVGWLVHRWRRAVLEERRARERERLRKLRKKGKGRSRAAGRSSTS